MNSQEIILLLSILSSLLVSAITTWFLLRKRITSARAEVSVLSRENAAIFERSGILEKQNSDQESELHTIREEKNEAAKNLAEERARRESEQKRLEEYKEEIKGLNEKLSKEFELIAHRLMKSNAESFANTSKENVSNLLLPFSERLKAFEGIVKETYQDGWKERNSLIDEVKRLTETNQQLGADAQNLAKALKGDSKARGNWGELVLERVLERSGLRKGEEYSTQESHRGDDDQLYQPDVVIHLPDNKHLIIDSKVSLVDYEHYLSEDDDKLREQHLKNHIASVRKHIKDLSAKGYQHLKGVDAPEFVMMFVPIEASFSLTIQADDALFQDAWQQKIIIVSPTTLLATLRTVASIWQHEKQTRNAILIAKEGGALVDKIRSTFSSIEKLGTQVSTVMKTHNDIMTKFGGRGGLLGRANKMQQLGARAKGDETDDSKLPESLSENLEEDE